MEEHVSSTNRSPTANFRPEEEEPVASRAVLRQRAEDLGEEGLDAPILTELVTGFLMDANDELPVLRRHVAAGRLKQVETIAHRLKGGGATVGAEAFSAACRAIEQAAREGKEQVVQEIVDRLPALLEETQAEFRAVMGGLGESLEVYEESAS